MTIRLFILSSCQVTKLNRNKHLCVAKFRAKTQRIRNTYVLLTFAKTTNGIGLADSEKPPQWLGI